MSLIRTEKVSKKFGDNEVLKGVDLEVRNGEKIAILGPSGCGKSTFLRCLNCMEDPTGGSIYFEGVDLADMRVDINIHRQKIGMVFQGFNLFNNMNVLDNCTLAPVTLKKMSKDKAEQTAMRHLEAVGLADFARADVTRLSGGQKQRVAIARALCMKPKFLFVSEPTRGIDIGAKKLVLETLMKLNREKGMTVVIVSSELQELRSISDRIAIVSEGKVVDILAPDASDADFGLAMSGIRPGDHKKEGSAQ